MGNKMPLLWMGIDNQLSMGEKEEKKKENAFSISLHPQMKVLLRFHYIWITFPPTPIHFCSFHHLLV